jgi:hypothetical protein
MEMWALPAFPKAFFKTGRVLKKAQLSIRFLGLKE